MIELRHIRYFVVLAEELHFGRAAKRLHIAQPGLTYQIKALESVLGVLLLDRNRRRVELTHAGQILLEEGRRALTQAERAENLSRRAGSGEIGRLTIGATESAAWDLLPELIAEFHKRHKAVDLVIREMTSRMQLDALRNGEIDVGFLRAPVDTEGLVARVIREEKTVVLLPQNHRLTKQRTIKLASLASEPLIIHPSMPRPSWADFMISLCRNAGFEPQISQEAIRTTTAASFVSAGLGLTLMPESLKGVVPRGVVYRPLSSPAPTTQILVAHRTGLASPTVAGLMAVIQDLLHVPSRSG
jgi:DNA-binding transcriptional LysR family regulator